MIISFCLLLILCICDCDAKGRNTLIWTPVLSFSSLGKVAETCPCGTEARTHTVTSCFVTRVWLSTLQEGTSIWPVKKLIIGPVWDLGEKPPFVTWGRDSKVIIIIKSLEIFCCLMLMKSWHLGNTNVFYFFHPHLFFGGVCFFILLAPERVSFPVFSITHLPSSEKSHSGIYNQFFTGCILLMPHRHLKFNMSPVKTLTPYVYPLCLYSQYSLLPLFIDIQARALGST